MYLIMYFSPSLRFKMTGNDIVANIGIFYTELLKNLFANPEPYDVCTVVYGFTTHFIRNYTQWLITIKRFGYRRNLKLHRCPSLPLLLYYYTYGPHRRGRSL